MRLSPGFPDVIVTRIVQPGTLAIIDLLNAVNIRHLQSHGLIDASFGHQFNPDYFSRLPPSTLGGQRVIFSAHKDNNVGPLLSNGEVWPLSRSGMQIAPLLPKRLDLNYARHLRDGMRPLGVVLTFPDVDIDADPSSTRHGASRGSAKTSLKRIDILLCFAARSLPFHKRFLLYLGLDSPTNRPAKATSV
jgi:hypothetical protein